MEELCMKRVKCVKHLLFLALVWILACGMYLPAGAAAQKVSLSDSSGNYLEKKGKSWYLLDAEGETLSGIQYLKLKKSKPYATGYYFVRENGKVCTGKHFHTVKNQTANGKNFTEHIILAAIAESCIRKRAGQL